MKQYFSFFRIKFISGLQYRTAALAGMSTQFFWGGMLILLYRTLSRQAPHLLPMDMQALASYIWLQQATLSLFILSWDRELFDSVRTGSVAYELLRPTDLYGMWTVRNAATRLSRAALRALPIIVFASLLPAPYGLRLTVSFPVFLLFLLSMFLMLWVTVSIVMLCHAFSFFMEDANGLSTLLYALSDFFGGGLVPLPFFPDKLRKIAELSPFGSMANVPLRIFGGDIPIAEIPQVMALQLFWAVSITLAGYAIMHRGLRRSVVAGG